MIQLGIDEDVNEDIIRGLRDLLPQINVVRGRDVGLIKVADHRVLQWAAAEGRVLVTHDIQTLVPKANQRVREGLPMPGVILIQQECPVGAALEELELLILCMSADEFINRVIYIPNL